MKYSRLFATLFCFTRKGKVLSTSLNINVRRKSFPPKKSGAQMSLSVIMFKHFRKGRRTQRAQTELKWCRIVFLTCVKLDDKLPSTKGPEGQSHHAAGNCNQYSVPVA